MFVKVINPGYTRIFPFEGEIDFGIRFIESDPQTFDLPSVIPGMNYVHVLFDQGDVDQFRVRHECETVECPERDKEYWKLSWAKWQEPDQTRGIVTLGEVYVLGDNGKTIDRVK